MVSKRYIRDEEIVGVELQKTRDSVKDVQSPTGTEKALTKDVAEQAAAGVVIALEQAEQAIEDAANALTTSNGKNSRRRGQTEPAPPPGGWVQGDQWVVDNDDGKAVEVRVWDGDEFVPEQILASEILVLSGGLVRLANGVVTASAIAADAIDGMIITGAVLRTAATGQRFQLDAFGLRAYDSTGTQTALLTPNNGGLSLMGGGLGIYSGVAYTQLTLTPTQIDFSSDGGNLHTYLNNDFLGFWKLGGDDCYVRLNGLKQRRQVAVSGGTRKLQTSVESTTSQAELSLLIESPTMQKTAGVLGAFDSNGDPVTFLNADTARVNRVTPQSGNRLQLTANVDIEATAPLTFGAASKISRPTGMLKIEDGTKVQVEAPAVEVASTDLTHNGNPVTSVLTQTTLTAASGTTVAGTSVITKDSLGLVQFNVIGTRTVWTTGGTTTIGTFPAGCRPSATVTVPVVVYGAGTPYLSFGQITAVGVFILYNSPTNGQSWTVALVGMLKAA